MFLLALRRRSLTVPVGLILTACALRALSIGFAQVPPPAADRSLVSPFLKMPPSLPLEPGQWLAVPAFAQLRFEAPTALVHAPRSNRWYVCEREGRIKCFENDPGAKEVTLVLDLSGQCQGVSDCGLLGLAFHPEFGKPDSPNRGYFYVFYNYADKPVRPPDRPPTGMKTWDRLARFTVPDGAVAADPRSELVLIDQEDEQLFHTGGAMFFHSEDGFLYLALGDEGGGAGVFRNCQLIDKDLFSGVLRIDVDCDPQRSHPPRRQPRSGTTANYFIPNDNPFVGVANALEEFWCLGLRNPHRMSIDPVTRRIWLVDVGDGGADPREEINLLERAGNYQWNFREGTVDRGFAPRPATIIGMEKPPLYEYPHTNGNRCVIGGHVYRGREHAAALGGKYIFGDFGSGRIWALTHHASKPPEIEELCTLPANARQLTTFGVDPGGELFLVEMTGGRIHKLARYGSAAAPLVSHKPLPGLLSQTGAFRDTVQLAAADGLVPYEVNTPLFSDNTVKRRWIAVPNAGPAPDKIKFKATGEWSFPAGTVFVKHFDLGVDETNPQATTRLETRFLVRDPLGSVYGVTYKWRPDQRDADLLDHALTENLTITLAKPMGPLTGVDLGEVERSGATRVTPTGYELFAGASTRAQPEPRLHFAQQQRTGDFDVRARIGAPAGMTAGIIARESVTPACLHIGVFMDPDPTAARHTLVFQKRTVTGQPTHLETDSAGNTTGWLRLQRVGTTFSAFASPDGVRWTSLGAADLAMNETIHLGIVVAAAKTSSQAPVVVRHLSNVREQPWMYPGRNDCLTCHNANAKFVLGVNARQLNGECTDPRTGRRENQLRRWSQLGMFDDPLTNKEINGCAKMVDLGDASAALEDRVRSYLDANCGYCHRPNGAPGYFDARYETPLAQQGIVDGSVVADLGVADARVIAPHDDGRSLLYERMKRCDKLKMPPLGRSVRDGAAVKAVREWISILPLRPAKPRLAKRLAAVGGALALALLVSVGVRRWLQSRWGVAPWLARVVPGLIGLGVVMAVLAGSLMRLDRARDQWILIASAAVSSLVVLATLARRPSRQPNDDGSQPVKARLSCVTESPLAPNQAPRRAA